MSKLSDWMTTPNSFKLTNYFMARSNRVTKNLDMKVAAERERAIEKNVFIANPWGRVASPWGRVESVARNGIFSIINMRLRGLVYVEGDL